MSGATPTFFLSGINHSELRLGQQLTQDHLRALQQQVAENTERARALQQLQQQAQQSLRAVAAVKAEPGVKQEDGGAQAAAPAQQPMMAVNPQQLQALLALQLQQRAAAAAAAQQQAQAAAGAHAQAKQVVKQEPKKQQQVVHEEVKAEGAEETDQWVQCSKCQVWRQVPDEFWPEFENADEDEDWFCKDALWDVQEYEPFSPPCC